MDSTNVYFVAPRQGSGSPSEYQDDVEWATGPAVPRTYFQGGTDMKWTSSAESSQSAMSRYSDVASSAIPSPNTDYATMSPYGTSPQPYEYDQNYTLSSQPVRNVSYSSYRKPENCVGQLAENVLPSRHTPSSLKWRLNSDLLKLYSFIVTRGKEPYFELLPRWTATQATPQIVHLDSTNNLRGVYPCHYPDACRKSFNRPADLDRHYKNVHGTRSQKDCYSCDYTKCGRSEEPFTRKDHYRDHLRDYHKEDLGRAKIPKDKTKLSSEEWPDLQQQWLGERSISKKWWRCARCLSKIYVNISGWDCPSCKLPCELDRKERRQIAHEPAVASDNYQQCATCAGTGWMENINKEYDACYMCNQETTSQSQVTDTSYYASEHWNTSDY